jgi:hypothetical protein
LSKGSAHCKAGTYAQYKANTQVFMPPVGFEPTTPVFEQAKIVDAVDRSAALIGKVDK